MPDDLQELGIILESAPPRLTCGDRSVRMGPQQFALLSALRRGPITARAAKVRLWGDPEAKDVTLRTCINRTNAALERAGCQVEVGSDRGQVLLRPVYQPPRPAARGTRRGQNPNRTGRAE